MSSSRGEKLRQGLARHQAGRLAEAEALYREILAEDPTDFDALHLLGLVTAAAGRLAPAIDLIERALRQNPEAHQAHYNLGSLRQKAGDSAGAEACYRRAVALMPGYAAARFSLASLLQARGEAAGAVTHYEAGLEADPKNAQALNNLGVVHLEQGRIEPARAALEAAIALRPDYGEAHGNLGQLWRAAGADDQAAAAYRRALELKPEVSGLYHALAGLEQARGDQAAALGLLRRAVARDPRDGKAHQGLARLLRAGGDTAAARRHLGAALEAGEDDPGAAFGLALLAEAAGWLPECLAAFCMALTADDPAHWAAFARALRLVRFDHFDAAMKALLLRAALREDLDTQDLVTAGLSLLKEDPALAPLWRLAETGPPETGPPETGPTEQDPPEKEIEECLALASDPLFLALVARALLPDPVAERVLTLLRRCLLGLAQREKGSTVGAVPLAFALAAQCEHNEYLLPESAAEKAEVGSLIARLSDETPPWEAADGFRLAVLACYRPLRQIDGLASKLGPVRAAADETLGALLRRQFDEPAEEARLASLLERLEATGDPVSQAVRQQYEENPYPRWLTVKRLDPRLAAEAIAALLPGSDPILGLPEAPSVLIAGCGTGRHAILAAMLYRDAQVLALDLSRASLAYAARKAAELGRKNIQKKIRFLQGDILALKPSLGPFDIVECSGVLHHMADPLAGWQKLLSVLKPGGVMKVALYSAAARRHVVALRDFIAAEGFAATPEGIRACRAAVLARGDQPAMAAVAGGRDFYSLSLCRDLLFHVQEHRFTVGQIAAAIDSLGLEFLGFEWPDARSRRLFLERFPDDPRGLSFENWQAFEAAEPDCFAEMYQFWLRKPD